MTAALGVAAASVVRCYYAFEHDDLLLVLSWNCDGEVVLNNKFFLGLFLEESLFDLTLLLFSEFHHNFLDSGVHFFSVFFSGYAVAVYPRMLHDFIQRNSFFGIRV